MRRLVTVPNNICCNNRHAMILLPTPRACHQLLPAAASQPCCVVCGATSSPLRTSFLPLCICINIYERIASHRSFVWPVWCDHHLSGRRWASPAPEGHFLSILSSLSKEQAAQQAACSSSTCQHEHTKCVQAALAACTYFVYLRVIFCSSDCCRWYRPQTHWFRSLPANPFS